MFTATVKQYRPEYDAEQSTVNYTLEHVDEFTIEEYPERRLLGIQRIRACNTRDFHKKFFRVVDDPEYCYKLQKTQVRARGGAHGLYKFLEAEAQHGPSFFFTKVIGYCMDEMKEAKT